MGLILIKTGQLVSYRDRMKDRVAVGYSFYEKSLGKGSLTSRGTSLLWQIDPGNGPISRMML